MERAGDGMTALGAADSDALTDPSAVMENGACWHERG